MRVYFQIITILIQIRILNGLVSSNDIWVRLSPEEYALMIASEGVNELLSLPLKERKKIWKKRTRQYFRARKCSPDKKGPCIATFLLCSTFGKSANERITFLRQKFMAFTPPKKIGLLEIRTFYNYSNDVKSCFRVSTTPKIAREVAANSCKYPRDMCLIHSLTPMMKITPIGIVDEVTTKVQAAGGAVVISIYCQLSPYYEKHNNEISLNQIVQSTLQSTSIPHTCKEQVRDTFPKIFKTISCKHTPHESEIENRWENESSVSFYITLWRSNTSSSQMIAREKILTFIAGLSTRPELVSLDVFGGYSIIFD